MLPKRKIYLASSWRNRQQPEVLSVLRNAGHEVYDFRNPKPNSYGFGWSQIDKYWQSWTSRVFREALSHPIAEEGFNLDWQAMQWADTGVLLLHCGRSAHLEAGYFVGAGKPLDILLTDGEPELMYKMATSISLDVEELLENLAVHTEKVSA